MVSITTFKDSATHCTAIPPVRRRHLRTCGECEKYITVLIVCGTPAARRWLPQALALPTFFATFFVEWKTFAMRYVGSGHFPLDISTRTCPPGHVPLNMSPRTFPSPDISPVRRNFRTYYSFSDLLCSLVCFSVISLFFSFFSF